MDGIGTGRQAGAPIVTPGYFYIFIYLFGGLRQIVNFVHSRRHRTSD